jgi:hypothetical protein
LKEAVLQVLKRRITMKRFVLFAAVTLASSSAFAQGKTTVVQEADRTVFRKKTVVDFSDVAVEGDLTKPEGTYALSKKKTYFKSLIRVRDNFVPELQKSVDNL